MKNIIRSPKKDKFNGHVLPSPLSITSSYDELKNIQDSSYGDTKKHKGNEVFINPSLICFLVILTLSINTTLSTYNIVQMIFMAMSCDIALSFFKLNKNGVNYHLKNPSLIVLRSTIITSISLITTMMGPLLLGLVTNNIPTLARILANNNILNISLGIAVLALDQTLRIIIPENNYAQDINSPNRMSNDTGLSLENVFLPITKTNTNKIISNFR